MSAFDRRARPRLAQKARLRWDAREGKHLLLYPERGLLLNGTGGEIVKLCDGRRTLEDIAAELARAHGGEAQAVLDAVLAFAERLRARGLLEEGS